MKQPLVTVDHHDLAVQDIEWFPDGRVANFQVRFRGKPLRIFAPDFSCSYYHDKDFEPYTVEWKEDAHAQV